MSWHSAIFLHQLAMFITEQVIPGDLQPVLFPVKFVYHTLKIATICNWKVIMHFEIYLHSKLCSQLQGIPFIADPTHVDGLLGSARLHSGHLFTMCYLWQHELKAYSCILTRFKKSPINCSLKIWSRGTYCQDLYKAEIPEKIVIANL